MRPPSKHGLERKFKPWRKGKSSKKASIGIAGGGSVKRPTNTSLKNRLRGQKRLLAKLHRNDINSNEDGGEEGDDNKKNNEATITGVEQSIEHLERDIASYYQREREKKNASKYHQVKFIERQKLMRLEKSVKRQLQALQLESNNNSAVAAAAQQRACQLRQQLDSIAMDQLYVALYPTNKKYVALFANGCHRVADDEWGEKRRKGAWAQIKEELRKGAGSVEMGANKTWVNLDAAKQALLAMPEGSYPSNDVIMVGPYVESNTAKTQNKEGSVSAAPDSRFTLSKELDGLFPESTPGNDYQERSRRHGSDGDCQEKSDSSSLADEGDDADPLKDFKSKTTAGMLAISANDVRPEQSSSSSSAPSSSSSSSSSSSEDSSDDDSSDSDDNGNHHPKRKQQREDSDDKEEDVDDFFAADAATSTGEVFAQAQQNNEEKRKNSKRQRFNHEEMPYRKASDKSKGFKSQDQSKKGYREFKARQNRQKLG